MTFDQCVWLYENLFPNDGLDLERHQKRWYVRDRIDDANFGGGETAFEALLELIYIKRGGERIDR